MVREDYFKVVPQCSTGQHQRFLLKIDAARWWRMTSLDNGPDIGQPGGNARGGTCWFVHVCSAQWQNRFFGGSQYRWVLGLGVTENPEAKSTDELFDLILGMV